MRNVTYIADNELRKPLPDLADVCRIALAHVDMPGPDPREHESPYANENVDEHFHRCGRTENPAWLILDALRGGLARISASVMLPLATAAPSVLTDSAIHAPAAIGC